jgi:hypothetical protein
MTSLDQRIYITPEEAKRKKSEEIKERYDEENEGLPFTHYRALSYAAKLNAQTRAEMLSVPEKELYEKTLRMFRKLSKKGRIQTNEKEGQLFCSAEESSILEDAFLGYHIADYLGIKQYVVYEMLRNGKLRSRRYGLKTTFASAKQLRELKEKGQIYPLADAAIQNTAKLLKLFGGDYEKIHKCVLQRFQRWARDESISAGRENSNGNGRKGGLYRCNKETFDFLCDAIPGGDELSQCLNISPSTMGRHLGNGTLKGKKIGGRNVYSIEQIESLSKIT